MRVGVSFGKTYGSITSDLISKFNTFGAAVDESE